VNYSDGNYNHIDYNDEIIGTNGLIGAASLLFGSSVSATYPEVGYFIEIDSEVTRNLGNGHNFSPYFSSVKILGMERVELEGGDTVRMFIDANRDLIAELKKKKERYK